MPLETSPLVFILDLSVDPELYRPRSHWTALLGGVPFRSVHLPSAPVGEALPEVGAFTHLIVTGSEASIVEPQPWFAPAEDLVRRAVDAGRPVLGSCFGHQLVVRALLGPTHVRRAHTPELGWRPVAITAAGPPVAGRAQEIWMFCCHFDEVCDLPSGWEVLARTPECGVHAYRLAGRPVWGIQAHPEIDPDEGAALLRGFGDRRPEVQPLVEAALAAPRRDDGFGHALVAQFLEAGR